MELIETAKPMSDFEMILQNEKALEQITARVDAWQSGLSGFFSEFEEYANYYRLIEGDRKNQTTGFTKTQVGETVRATEALTTSIYRMMTSADPPYEPVSLNGNQTTEELFAAHLQLRYQDHKLKWRRRLLRSVRNGVLFGTTIVENPWVQKYMGGRLQWEGLGYNPRSLLQCAFDPNVFSIEESPWACFLDYMTEDQLLDKAAEDPRFWNPAQIQKAIDESKTRSTASNAIDMRRRRAGYREMPMFEVASYYGRLRDLPRPDGRLWFIRTINMQYPVYAGPNPSPTEEIPWKVARYLDFEMEPYGYGVGRLGRVSQRHLNANRERYMDIITMSLFNMWIKDRMSGVKNSDLKIKPLGIIDADNINLIKPHIPDLNAVNWGIKLEELLKAEHQGNTGATPNLQAQVTEASATESSIAQNEAIRRVSVTAEDMADPLIRDYQMEKHAYNVAWLQTDQWLAVSGMEKPIRVNRETMAQELEIFVRVTTDKDFRPKRLEYLKDFLAFTTSIRNQLPPGINIIPAFEEYVRALDMDVRRVVPPGARMMTMQEQMMMNMKNSQQAVQELGPEAAAGMDEAGMAGPSIMDTPVGAVGVTP